MEANFFSETSEHLTIARRTNPEKRPLPSSDYLASRTASSLVKLHGVWN
jgi:hypothetical protein